MCDADMFIQFVSLHIACDVDTFEKFVRLQCYM